jgi:hypothetical protein
MPLFMLRNPFENRFRVVIATIQSSLPLTYNSDYLPEQTIGDHSSLSFSEYISFAGSMYY